MPARRHKKERPEIIELFSEEVPPQARIRREFWKS
jgi:hypothetical protein